MMKVVDKFLLELEAQLSDKNVNIDVSFEAREWLAKHGFDASMGARPMQRVIQEHIKRPLAEELLFGELEKGGDVNVSLDSEKDELIVDVEISPAVEQEAPV